MTRSTTSRIIAVALSNASSALAAEFPQPKDDHGFTECLRRRSVRGLVSRGEISVYVREGRETRLRRTGLEPVTFGSVDRCPESVTDGDTTTYDSDDLILTDLLTALEQESPDLAAVVRAWPKLPEAVRTGIASMVNTLVDGEGGGRVR
ncbi:MAG: hypothetical protein WBE26_17420 [Phycisphaerae bacterium]